LGPSLVAAPKAPIANLTSRRSSNDNDVTLHVGEPHANSAPTDVLEVWFVGSHADVGGGSVPNTVQSSLANVSSLSFIEACSAHILR
jgi:hypothetical protein